jgi:phosphatidylglycerophosphatase A
LLARLRDGGVPYWQQLLISGLFTGLSPFASGTVGSAVAALFYFIPGLSNFWALIALSFVAFIGGIPIASRVETAIGDDPSFVTLDEFAGQWLAMASPFVIPNPYWVVLTFFVFRAFDIAKVWPASYYDRQRGGLGIMADDMVAGFYANIASHLIWYLLLLVGPFSDYLRQHQ